MGFQSYWLVVGFLVIAALLVFLFAAQMPKSRRSRRQEVRRRRDYVYMAVPPLAAVALAGFVVWIYIFLKRLG